MSFPTHLPQAAIDPVVAVLLPLILPALRNDKDAASSLIRAVLVEYQPRTIQELQRAGEIIGLRLNTLNALAEAGQQAEFPERVAAARRAACSLSRATMQAERRYEALPREPLPEAGDPAAISLAETSSPPEPQPVQTEPPPVEASPAAVAEAGYNIAVHRLNLLKAHYKGAPPPHSKAAQDIQAQQRLVNMARIKLQQARQSHAVPATAAT